MGKKVSPPLAEAPLVSYKPGKGEEIVAGDLYQDSPVVFLLLRRPGCVICRAEARRLWSMHQDIEATGCKLVALLHTVLPSEIKAFWPAFWAGPLYLDTSKAFYVLAGRRGRLYKISWPKFFLTVCKQRRTQVPEDGNAVGLGFESQQMGGMVFVKAGGAVTFTFCEKDFGDHLSKEEILRECAIAAGQKPASA